MSSVLVINSPFLMMIGTSGQSQFRAPAYAGRPTGYIWYGTPSSTVPSKTKKKRKMEPKFGYVGRDSAWSQHSGIMATRRSAYHADRSIQSHPSSFPRTISRSKSVKMAKQVCTVSVAINRPPASGGQSDTFRQVIPELGRA